MPLRQNQSGTDDANKDERGDDKVASAHVVRSHPDGHLRDGVVHVLGHVLCGGDYRIQQLLRHRQQVERVVVEVVAFLQSVLVDLRRYVRQELSKEKDDDIFDVGPRVPLRGTRSSRVF